MYIVFVARFSEIRLQPPHWRKCSRLKCLFYNEMIPGSLDAYLFLPDYIRI